MIEKARRTADELADLQRPEGDADDTAEAFVEGFRQDLTGKVVPALEDLQRALKEKDLQAVQAASARLQALEPSASDRAARELGANSCVG